ncbi:MAG: methylenetetrahydrofolate reductase C-terminal domain-containing protein, partial [Thermodesulfobacteriota bacterium]|nr:methylenetetrahydrofolate reductase C-terminal domain-containing protein [Thermodesulfobacteriota bacterium]
NFKKVAILSCGFCSNFNGVGGVKGIKTLSGYLKKWDKEILVAECINVACCESIMQEAINIYIKPVISRCDVLIMLSCAGGVKTAFLCNPGIPIFGALDSCGSSTISRSDDYVAHSICSFCGQCVLTYTGGICPIGECSANLKYGPCKDAPMYGANRQCVLNSGHNCVWREITDRGGDLEALKGLKHMHNEHQERPVIPEGRGEPSSVFIKTPLAWFMAHTNRILARLAYLIR